jgi:hypothetical protein
MAWEGDAAVGPVDPLTKAGRRDPRYQTHVELNRKGGV